MSGRQSSSGLWGANTPHRASLTHHEYVGGGGREGAQVDLCFRDVHCLLDCIIRNAVLEYDDEESKEEWKYVVTREFGKRWIANVKEVHVVGDESRSADAMYFLQQLQMSRVQICKLDKLNLAFNSNTEWSDNEMFFVNLTNKWVKGLNLSYNSLRYLSEEMAESVGALSWVDIGGNEFDCSNCKVLNFQHWLWQSQRAILRVEIRSLNSMAYANLTCSTPKSLQGMRVIDVKFDNVSCDGKGEVENVTENDAYVTIIAPSIVGGFLLIAVVLGVLAYKYRFEISYIIHYWKLKKRTNARRISNCGLFEFDAFVSYRLEILPQHLVAPFIDLKLAVNATLDDIIDELKKKENHPSSPDLESDLDLPVLGSLAQHETSALANYATDAANALVVLSSTAEDGKIEVRISVGRQDRNWVTEELVIKLEKGEERYKLCLHERDFRLGSLILENIEDAMRNSRYTIMVLSRGFVLSQWCRWELEMANYKLFEDRREFLILIEKERLDRSDIPRHLKYLIDTRTYLEWPEPDQTSSSSQEKVLWRRLKKALGESLYQKENKWELISSKNQSPKESDFAVVPSTLSAHGRDGEAAWTTKSRLLSLSMVGGENKYTDGTHILEQALKLLKEFVVANITSLALMSLNLSAQNILEWKTNNTSDTTFGVFDTESLDHLDLRSNNLSTLPTKLLELKHLTHLDISSNTRQDRTWVTEYLLAKLENSDEKYHLCLHERDFHLGSLILENIEDSMRRSRFTIMVLSKGFVLSQWCRWELEMANYKLFEDRREFLILIEKERLDRSDIPRHLKYLIDTRTYLEWSEPDQTSSSSQEKVLWRRLKKALGESLYQKTLRDEEQKSKELEADRIKNQFKNRVILVYRPYYSSPKMVHRNSYSLPRSNTLREVKLSPIYLTDEIFKKSDPSTINCESTDERVNDTTDFVKVRFVFLILGMLGIAILFIVRVNLSVAIVAMVNNTALNELEILTMETDSGSDYLDLDVCQRAENESGLAVEDGEFTWSEETQGFILSGYFYGYAAGQLPGGILAERYVRETCVRTWDLHQCLAHRRQPIRRLGLRRTLLRSEAFGRAGRVEDDAKNSGPHLILIPSPGLSVERRNGGESVAGDTDVVGLSW
uniref:TIR domain-containing protein n=1 Tax=Timema genevievae TaxID=629358 RepID=A0A7R9JPS1_TIMGE|nr:unnamed protein product [Timema genevievae]